MTPQPKRISAPVAALALVLAIVSALPAGAQTGGAPVVRGKPSVGATPIEIPFLPPLFSPLPGQAMPATLPPMVPTAGIDRIDPRRHPDLFSPRPVPVPHVATGLMQGHAFALTRGGEVYGGTPHGYALFEDMRAYRRFLATH